MRDLDDPIREQMDGGPWMVAQIWWCGDNVCDCHQPKIDLVMPRRVDSLTVYDRYRVWEGEFVSQPDLEEVLEMKKNLKEAAGRFGIELDDEWEEFGKRWAKSDEVRRYKVAERRR